MIRAIVRLCSPFGRRRVERRRRESLPVDWRVFGSRVHRVSTTRDVSSGGAFVVTMEPEPVGTPILIAVSFEGSKVERHARVAFSDARGMGLRFTGRAG